MQDSKSLRKFGVIWLNKGGLLWTVKDNDVQVSDKTSSKCHQQMLQSVNVAIKTLPAAGRQLVEKSEL